LLALEVLSTISMLDQKLGALNKLEVEDGRRVSKSNTITVDGPEQLLELVNVANGVATIDTLDVEASANRLVDFNAVALALLADKAKLATEDELGTVDQGEGKERGGVGAVSVGDETTVGADSDELSVGSNELDTSAMVLDGEVLVGTLVLADSGDGTIASDREVLTVVGLEGDLSRARRIDLKLEALSILNSGLVSLDLNTGADGDLLALGVKDGELGLRVRELEELILGDLVLVGIQDTVGTNAGEVVALLVTERDGVVVEAKKEEGLLGRVGAVGDELAAGSEVLASVGLDAIATIGVLVKEHKGEESVLAPWDILNGAELVVHERNIAFAHDVEDVDLGVHGEVHNPLSGVILRQLLGESAHDLVLSKVDVETVTALQGPSAERLGLNSPNCISGGLLSITENLAISLAIEVATMVGLDEDTALISGEEEEDLLLLQRGCCHVEGVSEGLLGEVLPSSAVAEAHRPLKKLVCHIEVLAQR